MNAIIELVTFLVLMMTGEISLKITSDIDIVTARQKARWFAEKLGFDGSWPIIVSTIISGLARNVLVNPRHGRIFIGSIHKGMRSGISINAINEGFGYSSTNLQNKNPPSITTIDFQALIPKHIIDEFMITHGKDKSINIKMVKWL